MARAVEIALELKIFERDFALANSDQNAVLAECWRRTWWMVYLFDAFYAGTLGNTGFSVVHVDATVDLPCDEAQYESGNIPEPKTLREWDCREFDEEEKPFSSFACLIGAVRCATLAKDASLKSHPRKTPDDILHIADSILDSWMLLLPKSKKQVMLRNGDIDELMFQAHHLIHVVIIGFHRPLSDLKFNAVEDISSCARDPAPDGPTPEHINVHTVRVLRSVESQIRLLALPSRPFNHTPFCTCMISEGTLALLSACKFLLRGNELAIARDQIRLTIGCLKHLGDLWPRISRNVSQIQTIAKHVLSIEAHVTSKEASGSVHSATSVEENASSGDMPSSSSSDIFSAIRDFDDICGWYDVGELDPTLSFWPADQGA
ncbi:C6 zinc finger domain-containing protein [Cordyceps javanica]|uniref:C6 zinc finger domain-containing protein n=1 Tax=Cordyceps javanica TaxID=43265 RepID=A0A545UMP3_9HYPO|nr:C6 zinc finger domain-containing protein [Cordyceps javanica]TQW02264.1 C6 zinc finger domain protein [Cordyceps javanica]